VVEFQPAHSPKSRRRKGNRIEVRGDHAVIFIPYKGATVEILVDTTDLPLILAHTWRWNGSYSLTKLGVQGDPPKQLDIYLHRLLMVPPGTLGFDLQVDHINRDTRDNRRSNLRLATRSQNMANRKKPVNVCGGGFKGVSPNHRHWRAAISLTPETGKTTTRYLGTYDTQKEAALAYDLAAIEQHGEFAELNFTDDKPRYLRGEIPPPERRTRKKVQKLKVMMPVALAS
jgi:hypothetical protein